MNYATSSLAAARCTLRIATNQPKASTTVWMCFQECPHCALVREGFKKQVADYGIEIMEFTMEKVSLSVKVVVRVSMAT